MGIYDREYYRRDGPRFLDQFTDRGKVCKWLIAINLVAFLIQLFTMSNRLDARGNPVADGWFSEALILDGTKVFEQGQVWRLLTYAFLHSITWYHILFNMIVLWVCGSEMEEVYGPREFLALYLTSALLAGVGFILLDPGHRALGASGATTALLVLYACHYPHRTILFMFVIPMPVWVLVVILLGWDLLHALSAAQTGVAVTAHLTGALFGFLYYRFHWRLLSLVPDFRAWRRRASRPRLRVYREEPDAPTPVAVSAPAEKDIDEHLEAKLDAVLEKVSRVGKDNLTESERQILLRASEVYRKRRS